MPVTTAKLALRTPVTADNNDTPTFMLNLANDIVSSLDFGTFAARPAASAANQGRRYYATDRDREYFNTAAGAWQPLGGVPPGVISAFLISAIPTGWLLLDGVTVTTASTLYPDLWAVIPTAFKSGVDFLTPDMRARAPIGADSFGLGTGGARGNLAGLAVGSTTGANTKVQTAAQMPPHNHDMSHNHVLTNAPAGGHYHEVADETGANGLMQLAQVYSSGSTAIHSPSTFPGGPRDRTYSEPDHTHANTITGVTATTGPTGSGSAFNVVADSFAVVYCIRT
jgi:microcystin-dependent protein